MKVAERTRLPAAPIEASSFTLFAIILGTVKKFSSPILIPVTCALPYGVSEPANDLPLVNSEVKEIVVLSGIRELKFGTTPSTCVCLGNLTDAPPNLPVVSALLPASNWNPNPSAAVIVLSPLIFAAVIPLLSLPG